MRTRKKKDLFWIFTKANSEKKITNRRIKSDLLRSRLRNRRSSNVQKRKDILAPFFFLYGYLGFS